MSDTNKDVSKELQGSTTAQSTAQETKEEKGDRRNGMVSNFLRLLDEEKDNPLNKKEREKIIDLLKKRDVSVIPFLSEYYSDNDMIDEWLTMLLDDMDYIIDDASLQKRVKELSQLLETEKSTAKRMQEEDRDDQRFINGFKLIEKLLVAQEGDSIEINPLDVSELDILFSIYFPHHSAYFQQIKRHVVEMIEVPDDSNASGFNTMSGATGPIGPQESSSLSQFMEVNAPRIHSLIVRTLGVTGANISIDVKDTKSDHQ